MAKKNFDTLTEYGTSFQIKTVTTLLKNRKFLEQINDILDPKYYDSDAMQWIVKTVLEHYQSFRKPPTMEVFKLELDREIENAVMKESVIEKLRGIYNNFKASDLDYVEENFLKFAQNQVLKNALLESVNLMQAGNYEQIRNVINEAFHAGEERDIGVVWKEQEFFQRRIEDTLRSPIETPWDVINEITDGGIGAGEMGVVVAPGGIGKSWMLVAIANHATRMGKNVIYYTMELNEDYVGLRHDARTTGYASQDIKLHQEETYEAISKVRGNLIIKYYPTKRASIDTLRTHVIRTEAFGFKPDMIIIDYPDLLKGTIHYSKAEKRFELENIYEETRGLAGELNLPIWAASQANRSSLEDEIIEANRIAESYNKIMIADFVMSLQRKTKDKLAHTGRVHVIKNRFGPDGWTFPSKLNASNGNIQLFQEKTKDGQEATEASEHGGKLERMKIGEKVAEITERSKKLDELT